MRESGDVAAQMPDDEFVEALEYGMPPAFGFGMSERVFALFMDKSVRECQIFPLLRPLERSWRRSSPGLRRIAIPVPRLLRRVLEWRQLVHASGEGRFCTS
jgi:hypothetical protein